MGCEQIVIKGVLAVHAPARLLGDSQVQSVVRSPQPVKICDDCWQSLQQNPCEP